MLTLLFIMTAVVALSIEDKHVIKLYKTNIVVHRNC